MARTCMNGRASDKSTTRDRLWKQPETSTELKPTTRAPLRLLGARAPTCLSSPGIPAESGRKDPDALNVLASRNPPFWPGWGHVPCVRGADGENALRADQSGSTSV